MLAPVRDKFSPLIHFVPVLTQTTSLFLSLEYNEQISLLENVTNEGQLRPIVWNHTQNIKKSFKKEQMVSQNLYIKLKTYIYVFHRMTDGLMNPWNYLLDAPS